MQCSGPLHARMHEMVRIGDLELAVIDTASSVALPQITHEGRHYVVAEPGHEFQVVTTSHAHRQIQTRLYVDSELIDLKRNTSKPSTYIWAGFPTQSQAGYRHYNAFRFAPAVIAEPGTAIDGGDGDPTNGTIRAVMLAARKGKPRKPRKGKPHSWAPGGSNAKLVKKRGKKFYMSASLTTQGGSHVSKKMSAPRHKVIVEHEMASVTLHAETLEILRLRGIPIPQQLIREYFDRVASASGSGGAGGSGSSGGSGAVAASDSAAGRPLKRRRRAKLVAAKATAEAPINVDDAADDAVIDLT